MRRWIVFAVLTYLVLALQVGLASSPALVFQSRFGPVEPRFVLIFAVLVALVASPAATMIVWGVLGLLLDLTTTWPLPGDRALTLIGPYALGYLAGGYVVLQFRAMLVRRHPLAFAFMVLLGGAAVHLVVVGLFTMRAWYEPLLGWSAATELARRTLVLLYTAAIGGAAAIPLAKLVPLLGFPAGRRPAPWAARR